MRGFALLAAVTALTALASPPALGGTWSIPIREQVLGGFDHIQILMAYPYEFDSPAMSAFCGPSPVGELWSQTFLHANRFATADGPSPGDEAIHFAIWIGGDPQVVRPAFHFQAYLGDRLVDNANFTCFGPGETDWMIGFGTWEQSSPIPPWPPGDADLDGDVDATDLATLGMNWAPSGTDKTWFNADFDFDGDVDATDLAALGMNWNPSGSGAATPEPATIALTALGAAAAMAAGKRKR